MRIIRASPNENAKLTEPTGGTSVDTLYERVSRMRARWLKRVMYDRFASSSEKCLAYAVFDHLNCVTLDSWPSQSRLAQLLGFKADKTIQRAAFALVELEFLSMKRLGRGTYRYAPLFLPSDEDKTVSGHGQSRIVQADRIVSESLLPIQITGTPSTTVGAARSRDSGQRQDRYPSRQRGAHELALAEMLGPNGMEVLSRLAELDDAHVQRLCRAYSVGAVGERELAAARLAAQQAR